MECPVATLCEARPVVGSLYRHNVVPRTSRCEATVSVALETAHGDDPQPYGEQRVNRTCRL